jgi:glucose-6-phosphate isomerase
MKNCTETFQELFCLNQELGISLDVSRMALNASDIKGFEKMFSKAHAELERLEAGAISNADEGRMVGHYWLRSPSLSPDQGISKMVHGSWQDVQAFAARMASGDQPRDIILVGIGGSALGPQFVHQALRAPHSKIRFHFIDNTDPDGMARELSAVDDFASAICIIVSKSGSTKETRNGMLATKFAFEKNGENFAKHAVAITEPGSELDSLALRDGWLATFPLWSWVGGRTSELSPVGLLPAALAGYDITAMIAGAASMDDWTREKDIFRNPAALLAAAWYQAGGGKGDKNMVVIPYKDRLELFSRYLQQLIMESLGKRLDRNGKEVFQGITVFGNKGSTDQHAYIQQLRDGRNDFFVTFIEVLADTKGALSGPIASELAALEVESGITAGDYLFGFFMGTREALSDSGRESITITVPAINEGVIGALIALFERAVGYYASFINVNAYHQPGVEAGKKAAAEILRAQHSILDLLSKVNQPKSILAISQEVACRPDIVFKIIQRLESVGRVKCASRSTLFESKYCLQDLKQ